jgi:hypothetical protein
MSPPLSRPGRVRAGIPNGFLKQRTRKRVSSSLTTTVPTVCRLYAAATQNALSQVLQAVGPPDVLNCHQSACHNCAQTWKVQVPSAFCTYATLPAFPVQHVSCNLSCLCAWPSSNRGQGGTAGGWGSSARGMLPGNRIVAGLSQQVCAAVCVVVSSVCASPQSPLQCSNATYRPVSVPVTRQHRCPITCGHSAVIPGRQGRVFAGHAF